MSAHISDDLPRLLTGDATRDETLTAAQHLRRCPDCQQELVSAVVAHASLTSARRFAPEVIARQPAEPDVEAEEEAEPANREPLPDMSAVFTKVRAEAARPTPARRQRQRWIVAAAAAAVLAAGSVTAAELLGNATTHAVATTVTLRPVGDVRASARATISSGSMRIDATSLPSLGASRQYEVWLVAASGAQLRPLGYVGQNRTATLPVPQRVMARYTDIAISIQRTDQVHFSGKLVVRGSYA